MIVLENTSLTLVLLLQTEAEKAAWAISKAEGFELVTINPTFVLGPVISDRADATSILCFKVGPGALVRLTPPVCPGSA